MPTWGEITRELQGLELEQRASSKLQDPTSPSPHDIIRRKYLNQLSAHTSRSVIVYASGWLESRPVSDPSVVGVSTRDKFGFMEAVHDLDKGSLDLILHSPGGDPDAATAIMRYLREVGFDFIRAIIPISAMSAATMMALGCDEILMGHHSQLGPIDPQFTLQTPDGPRNAPAQAILDQFDRAKRECAESSQALSAWLPILRSYSPGLLSQCEQAQTAAEESVSLTMQKYMFKTLPADEAKQKAEKIAEWFNSHKTHRSHGKPLLYGEVLEQGVNVKLLENDNELQDKVLSAWHGIQLSLSQTSVSKLIENSKGKAWMLSSAPGIPLVLRQEDAKPSRLPSPTSPQPLNRQQRRSQGRKSR